MTPQTIQDPPAWTDPELGDPHANADKPDKVRRMFASIARSYDLNNRLHSFGRDQAWRRAAVEAAAIKPGDRVLDVACGTGDLTQAFARTEASAVVGLDFTPEMLDIARHKQESLPAAMQERVTYRQGDAMALPFEDGSFDAVSIAFGIRNVADPAVSAGEFFRVLRPGGRLVVLEFDRPRFAPARWACDLYTNRIMPWTATVISRDRSGAYRYLPRSVDTFHDAAALGDMLRSTGFDPVTSRRLTFGVCVCHAAHRPREGDAAQN